MSENFQLGSSETTEECWLKFHQYKIFDTSFKQQAGYLCVGTDGNFYVEPFVPNPPLNSSNTNLTSSNLGKQEKLSDLKKNI